MEAVLKARGDKAALGGSATDKIRISQLTAKFTTFSTGGSLITTPDTPDPDALSYPNQLGFDHMQSYFIGLEGNPAPNVRAEVNLNVVGNVAQNPIDEIFYENRSRPITVDSENGEVILGDINRVNVYQAEFEWNAKDFDLRGFYRTGHYHWQYEGDFFGLYPEANYGPNLDIYGGEILGLELDGKGATIAIQREFGKFDITLGGIWGGNPLNGTTFQNVTGTSGNYTVFDDVISSKDNWGGKAKIVYEGGRFNMYAQSAIMGLVAGGGFDATQTFTGWRLKDSGSGNMANFLSGFTYSFGNLQIAPNFMYQKPLVDPMPNDVTGPGRLRNVIDDPFAVRGGNRETTAGEVLFTFDPTPGTWMYQWDNDRAEDAKFAMNSDLGIIGNFYYGNAQGNGDSDRLIKRFGGDIRMIYNKMKVETHVKVNDWGPFDYHRDFNLTFPLQLMLDVSTSLGKPDWFILPGTTLGVRGTWRSLNEFSPRFLPNQAPEFGVPPLSPVGFPNGSEWEIRTYVHINIGK